MSYSGLINKTLLITHKEFLSTHRAKTQRYTLFIYSIDFIDSVFITVSQKLFLSVLFYTTQICCSIQTLGFLQRNDVHYGKESFYLALDPSFSLSIPHPFSEITLIHSPVSARKRETESAYLQLTWLSENIWI